MLYDAEGPYPLSEGELAGISSALRAIRPPGAPYMPITVECETIVLDLNIYRTIDRMKILMYQFFVDHHSSLEEFKRNGNQWILRYHYLSVYISVYKVDQYHFSELDHDDHVETTTHVSFIVKYNLQDMYQTPMIDESLLAELVELYSTLKTELSKPDIY